MEKQRSQRRRATPKAGGSYCLIQLVVGNPRVGGCRQLGPGSTGESSELEVGSCPKSSGAG